MAEIPDLSKLKDAQPEAPEQPKPLPRTAFLVVVDADGNIQVSTADIGLDVQQVGTTDDVYTSCALIMKDIQVQQTAGLVQQGLLQMGSLMQKQQQDQQLRQHLNLK